MLFVLDLDDPDSGKPGKGKSARKPLDLDAPADAAPTKTGKGDGKLEIVRDTDSTYRRKPLPIDRVKERKRRKLLTSILVGVTVVALILIGNHFLNRKPTLEDAKNARLPITSAPANAPVARRLNAPAPVIPGQQPDPRTAMPGLNEPDDRGRDSTAGGIH